EIVGTIAVSVRGRTTPFRWMFLSRPEPHLIASFTAHDMHSLSYNLELPVSRDIDNEIVLYLTDELRGIEPTDSWFSEQVIQTLVNFSAGFFINAGMISRLIRNSLEPVSHLHAVLAYINSGNVNTDPAHPLLSEFDLFYTFIMQCVPSETLLKIQAILLLVTSFRISEISGFIQVPKVIACANVLGLSEKEFRNACDSLISVLHFGTDMRIAFHHRSFKDFLEDSRRSGKFCIQSHLHPLRCKLLAHLDRVHSCSLGKNNATSNITMFTDTLSRLFKPNLH
ncbi:hypothetical protein P691DRAFT_690118, partial [Macrolepiota fuliginosa MF-IS2]